MKPVLYLRAASLLTLLHAVLHTIGGVFGKPDLPPEQAAVAAMKANQFPLMGVTRSYWDFYIGFGLGITILLTVIAAVLWQLSSLAKTDSCRLRPIYMAFLAAFLLFAVNSSVYFFPLPAIMELVIAICLALAIFTSRPARRRQN